MSPSWAQGVLAHVLVGCIYGVTHDGGRVHMKGYGASVEPFRALT